MGQTTLNNDLIVSGALSGLSISTTGNFTAGGIIVSTGTATTLTLVNADNGKVYHSGEVGIALTLPEWSTLATGWTIGIANIGGNTITLNKSGTSTINGVNSVINNSIYTGFYVYKSDTTNQFIAMGTVY